MTDSPRVVQLDIFKEFNLKESERLKIEGMARASERAAHLKRAREIATLLAMGKHDRCITADHVGREMKRLGLQPLGPAAGSLFRGKNWVFTGNRIRSSRVTNHARELKVWKLINEDT